MENRLVAVSIGQRTRKAKASGRSPYVYTAWFKAPERLVYCFLLKPGPVTKPLKSPFKKKEVNKPFVWFKLKNQSANFLFLIRLTPNLPQDNLWKKPALYFFSFYRLRYAFRNNGPSIRWIQNWETAHQIVSVRPCIINSGYFISRINKGHTISTKGWP